MPTRYQAAIYPIRHDNAATVSAERAANIAGGPPELAATANISAFNLANALGGLIGGAMVDSSFGASTIPFAAAIVPAVALLFIMSQERGSSVAPALSQPALKEAML